MSLFLESALELARIGFAVFPLAPRGKSPLIKKSDGGRGCLDATTDEAQIRAWWGAHPSANIGIATGKVSGIVVVDVDGEDGQAEFQRLIRRHGPIPKTAWARTGGGGDHFLFRHPGWNVGNSRRRADHIDTRGDGGYIAAAPSIHPDSGKAYEWINHPRDIPPADAPDWVMLLFFPTRDSEAANGESAAPPAFPLDAGLQDRICKTLVRMAVENARERKGRHPEGCWLAKQLQDHRIPLEVARGAMLEYQAAVEVCGWNPARVYTRDEAIKSLAHIYEHFTPRAPWRIFAEPANESAPVADGNGAEPDKPNEELAEAIKWFNQKYAVGMVGGHAVAFYRVLNPAVGCYEMHYIKLSELKLFYANRTVLLGKKRFPAADLWIKAPDRRTYRGVTFLPGGTVPPGWYNTWAGFSVTPAQGDVDLYLEHLHDVICAGSDNYFEWLISWMADAVQHPSERPGTAVVIRGPRGSGKTMAVQIFGKLFGYHYKEVTQAAHLTGRFNGHMEDALVLYCNEAFGVHDKQAESQLKALITDPFIMIEGKGLQARRMPNFIRLILTSNDDWVVPAGGDERRYCVLDSSGCRVRDWDYFRRLAEFGKPEGQAALLDYLMNFKIQVNLKDAPATVGLHEQKTMSMPLIDDWWQARLDSGCIGGVEWPERIPESEVYEDFTAFLKSSNQRDWPRRSVLRIRLLKLCKSAKYGTIRFKDTRVSKGYYLPTLEQAKKEFEAEYRL